MPTLDDVKLNGFVAGPLATVPFVTVPFVTVPFVTVPFVTVPYGPLVIVGSDPLVAVSFPLLTGS
jgi:hypothetical protein